MPLLAGEEEGDIDSYTSDVSENKQDELNQMLKVSIVLNIITIYAVFKNKTETLRMLSWILIYYNSRREDTYFKLATDTLVF